jgi:ABC-2 type transport system permease protein
VSRYAVAVILRAELRAWRNRITRGNSVRIVALVLVGFFGGVVFGGSLFGVAFAAGAALPSARDAILAGAFTALSVLMLVVGFPTVIASYFAGRDLMQLILAPVKTSEIFLARSLFAMSANILVGTLFLTFIVGLGAGSGASPLYYLLALVLVVVQVLLVSALQVNFMAAVLRWVPARIARDVAVAVASVTGAGLYLAWNLTIRQSFTATRRTPDISHLVSTLQSIEWVPSAWPGHALSAVINGDGTAAVLWTGLTLLLAFGLVTAAVLLYERTLLAGLGLLGGVPGRRRNRSAARANVATASGGTGSPGLAIARKDWIVYRRDIRRLSRFFPALIFLFVYAFVLVRPGTGTDVFWSGVFIVAFVSFFMSMLFGTTAIPSERRGFQLLRLAPITSLQLIRTKVLFTVAPVVVLTTFITIASSVVGGIGIAKGAQLTVLAVWLALGCVSIGVSAGAIDPQFESADDRRVVGVLGTFAAMGGELAFGLLSVGAFALVQLAEQLASGTGGFGFVTPSAATAALAAGLAVLPAAGGVGVVVLMLWSANSHLRSFEGSITSA